ncbi:hypothetical protein EGW08_023617 [Elysia chlorotica]|uniref:Uncharacterized protein n=1 Tax=Elysia chlorotica TaxID=188477 RepID=A0A433SIA0_ELYCH|nr:hypothetical protein EGW08_023617 [Elysia chlorotica]
MDSLNAYLASSDMSQIKDIKEQIGFQADSGMVDQATAIKLEMTLLTAFRTAAATVVATECLARQNSHTIAIIGTGAQTAIKELQAKGYKIPDYPADAQSDEQKEIKARYAKVLGSAVNPVLREGNSDRRVAAAVKEYAEKHPHSMEVFFADVFTKYAKEFKEIGVNSRNGWGDAVEKIKELPLEIQDKINADIEKVFKAQPDLAMVNSDKGITNLNVPSDVIIDASMPAAIRSSGEFLALGASLEDMAIKTRDVRIQTLADTLGQANKDFLEFDKSPRRRVGELDTRGSHFYLSFYWAKALANQNDNQELKAIFAPIFAELEKNEAKIVKELADAQGVSVDVGGYYQMSPKKLAVAMRPSKTLNTILAKI